MLFRPVYHYKSKVFFEETNLNIESQNAYGLLGGRLGIEFPENKLSFIFL